MRGNVRSRDGYRPRSSRSPSRCAFFSAEPQSKNKSPSATRTSRVARSASSSAPRARVHATRGRDDEKWKTDGNISPVSPSLSPRVFVVRSRTPRNASSAARRASRSRFKRSPATTTRRASVARSGGDPKPFSSGVSADSRRVRAKRAAALSAAPSQCAAGRPRGVSHRRADRARRQEEETSRPSIGSIGSSLSLSFRRFLRSRTSSRFSFGSGSRRRSPASAFSAASSHHAASARRAEKRRRASSFATARFFSETTRTHHLEKHARSGLRTR